MLEKNMSFTLEKVVKENETAEKVASGALDVFSTPMLIAFMENTAFKLVEPHLENGLTTVGTAINMKHLKANLVGDKLRCTAKLVEIDRKRLQFQIEVTYEGEIVGSAEHERFIVDEKKFMEKLKNR